MTEREARGNAVGKGGEKNAGRLPVSPGGTFLILTSSHIVLNPYPFYKISQGFGYTSSCTISTKRATIFCNLQALTRRAEA